MGEDCLSINIVRPARGTAKERRNSVEEEEREEREEKMGWEGKREDGNEEEKNKKGLLPVVVWIHGGSYQVGSSGLPNYNLTYMVAQSVAADMPIVAASINYRKGAWGMLYSREIQVSPPLDPKPRTQIYMHAGIYQVKEELYRRPT